MRIHHAEDLNQAGRLAAGIFAAEIRKKPDLVLGLATGSSPIGLYAALVGMALDFSRVKTVNLDEYVGLSPENEHSYRRFMNEHLFSKVNIDMKNTHMPDGMAEDLDGECDRYDKIIDDLGGIDLQLLGIGHNGHIGFNEPAPIFSSGTSVVELAQSTINANSRLFADPSQVPRRAITMGIKQILQSRRIVLIAGASKSEIINRALNGPIVPAVPASALQLHRDLTVCLAES
jgi:glucosamine-6-phosphate deaminase